MKVSLPQHLDQPTVKCGRPADIVILKSGSEVSKLEMNCVVASLTFLSSLFLLLQICSCKSL